MKSSRFAGSIILPGACQENQEDQENKTPLYEGKALGDKVKQALEMDRSSLPDDIRIKLENGLKALQEGDPDADTRDTPRQKRWQKVDCPSFIQNNGTFSVGGNVKCFFD